MSGFRDNLFKDRVVVITGAGRGIGLAAAKAFLACGATLIAHLGRGPIDDPDPDLAKAVDEGRAHLLVADFSERQARQTFARDVAGLTDHIDVLVNNAGTMIGRFQASEISDENYDRIVSLNQSSVVELTRDLLPLVKAGAEPAIIVTGSIAARVGGSSGSAIYAGAKAFVTTYTRALAREVAADGIRVNAVSPGTIYTDFHDRYSSAEKRDATQRALPMQRLGTAEDCAPSYLFLASAELSGYITGQTVEVNGGQLMV